MLPWWFPLLAGVLNPQAMYWVREISIIVRDLVFSIGATERSPRLSRRPYWWMLRNLYVYVWLSHLGFLATTAGLLLLEGWISVYKALLSTVLGRVSIYDAFIFTGSHVQQLHNFICLLLSRSVSLQCLEDVSRYRTPNWHNCLTLIEIWSQSAILWSTVRQYITYAVRN
jgi:hypothetical protein